MNFDGSELQLNNVKNEHSDLKNPVFYIFMSSLWYTNEKNVIFEE